MSLQKIKPIYFTFPPVAFVTAAIFFILVLDWDTQSVLAQILIYALIVLAIAAGLATIIELPFLLYFISKKQKSVSAHTQSKITMFGKIESKEQAIQVINHVSKVFVLLGVTQIFITVFLDVSLEIKVGTVIAGITFIALALLIKKFKKIIIAIIFLLFSLAWVVIASLKSFGMLGDAQNKSIPIMGIAFTIASIQAIRAIFRYNYKE